MPESIVVLGATSGIARALTSRLAARGHRLLLAGRDVAELQKTAVDLQIRFQVAVHVEAFRADDYEGHAAFVDRCSEVLGDGPDGVVLCYGELPDQEAAFNDATLLRKSIDVNLTSAMVVLNLFAARLAARRRGFIAAISSVAGDRGRRSNFIYGAAKAGLTAYLSGLRSRLSVDGVHVLTIKPGQVDTKMTLGFLDHMVSLPFQFRTVASLPASAAVVHLK